MRRNASCAAIVAVVLALSVPATAVARPEAIDHDTGPTTAIPVFLFVALLFTLVPAWAGARLSRRAGIPAPAGFAIGLFATWIGVAGLYLVVLAREQRTPIIPTSASPAVDVRLKMMADLRDKGLITDAEHDERTAAIRDGS